jgi:hypothetical protein
MKPKLLLGLALVLSGGLTGYTTEIRVRNDSTIDFRNVVVGGKNYGDIKRGAVTDYQTWVKAYRYSLVSLLADSKPLKIQPEDYVGETQLGDGHFTYVLTIQEGRLDIRAEEDKFALVLSGGLAAFSTNAAETNSLRVVVNPSKTEVRVKEKFKVALRVENPTATNQTVRVWSCSWDQEWKTSNTNISWIGWDCTRNGVRNVEIPSGGAYTNELEMIIPKPISEKTLSFRMGFTPIDSTKTFWSEAVVIGVAPQLATNEDLTKQVSSILTECQKIKPGMKRAELLKTFTTEGGLSSAMHRSFVYRGCPYIKVDVEFTLSEPGQTVLEERPADTINKISKPYLEWRIND